MITVDTNTRAGRMIAAGRITLTFRSPKTGEHITLIARASAPPTDGSKKWHASNLNDAKILWIEVPNQGGWNDKVAKYTRGKGLVPDKNADPARVFCARQLLAYVTGQPTAEGLEIFEENHCGRCGRALTDPESIAIGIGPDCRGMDTGSKHETKVRPAPTSVERQILMGEREPVVPETFEQLEAVTDKKGREVPRTFEQLAGRVA